MIKTSKLVSVSAVVLVAGLVAACPATERVKYSGFLKNYSQLKPDPKFDGALRWQDPKVNLASYNKFIVDPVLIHFATKADSSTVPSCVTPKPLPSFRKTGRPSSRSGRTHPRRKENRLCVFRIEQ